MITRTLASKIESMAGTFPVVTVDLRLELRRVAKLLTDSSEGPTHSCIPPADHAD